MMKYIPQSLSLVVIYIVLPWEACGAPVDSLAAFENGIKETIKTGTGKKEYGNNFL